MSYINIPKLSRDISEIKALLTVSKSEFITVDEAAKHLNLKKSYIYSLIHQRKISFYKPLGKRVYFDKLELNKWITASKIKSVEEVEEDYNKQKETEVK